MENSLPFLIIGTRNSVLRDLTNIHGVKLNENLLIGLNQLVSQPLTTQSCRRQIWPTRHPEGWRQTTGLYLQPSSEKGGKNHSLKVVYMCYQVTKSFSGSVCYVTTNLAFVCPCIVSIIVTDDQQDATIWIIYTKSALHVSGDVFAHHQEHLTVFTASGTVHRYY